MPRDNIPHVSLATSEINTERLESLRSLVPEAFSEGKVDFEKLKVALGVEIDVSPERYSFTWAGKRDAIRILQAPSRATFIPAREESLDFDSTQNIFIEGDNLETLKVLYKPYFGRVKVIYIDPPYNTGADFIYPDNFSDPLDTYLKLTGQKDTEGNLLTSNPESSGRYHSAWLSMMYPRLFIARQLLSEDGMIFVSIDDHEMPNLRLMMNEVFGEENFIENFVWKKSYGGGAKEKYAVRQHEYVLMYARNIEGLDELWLPPDENAEKRYYKFSDSRGLYRVKPLEATKSMDSRPNLVYPIPTPWGEQVLPKRQWWWSQERVMKAIENDELVFIRNGKGVSVSYKQYLYNEKGEKRGAKPFSIIDGFYTQTGTQELREVFNGELVMQFPKPVGLIKQLLKIGTKADNGEIIIDFFAGSATTAQAILELNREDGGDRRFIMIQLPEMIDNKQFPTIAEIGKERCRRVITHLKKDLEGKFTPTEPEDLGFKVLKLTNSNFRQWKGENVDDAQIYTKQIEMFADPLIEDWKEENVIYEVAIKEGFGLDLSIEKSGVKNIFRVKDSDKGQSFYISLSMSINLDDLRPLNLKADDLFICRDTALNDETAANLALQCRLKTI
jgi:adenine-specific DNA-methyltransferase